jgi:hypothetical protein
MTVQIVASLADVSRGVIYNHNIFIKQATGLGRGNCESLMLFMNKWKALLIVPSKRLTVDLIKTFTIS